MTLAIRKLVTICRASARRRDVAGLVDRIAHERFAHELGAHLGPALSHQPQIVRIRQLRVRVIIPPGSLNESAIAAAWVHCFGQALFEALAYPEGRGPADIVRASSRAEFLAALLGDVADGVAAERWQYAEFAELYSRPVSEAMLAILRAESEASTLDILAELKKAGTLERVLARWNEPQLAQLFENLDRVLGLQPQLMGLEDLEAAAKLLLELGVPRGWKLSGRRQALRLFVLAHRSLAKSPRVVAQALAVLVALLENPWLLTSVDELASLGSGARFRELERRFAGISPTVLELISTLARGSETRLAPWLDQIEPLLPTAVPRAAPPAAWIASECAGIFLLTAEVQRAAPDLFGTSMPTPFVLAGLALAVLGRLVADVKMIPPGVSEFAGFAEAPAMTAFRVFLAAPGLIQELEQAAEEIIRAFTQRVAGFRKSSREALVRQLIAKPGRIRMEAERVLVVLEPSPFHIALHISGADAAIASVAWLGGRRLEYRLEGL
jgi:hypothetical protein